MVLSIYTVWEWVCSWKESVLFCVLKSVLFSVFWKWVGGEEGGGGWRYFAVFLFFLMQCLFSSLVNCCMFIWWISGCLTVVFGYFLSSAQLFQEIIMEIFRLYFCDYFLLCILSYDIIPIWLLSVDDFCEIYWPFILFSVLNSSPYLPFFPVCSCSLPVLTHSSAFVTTDFGYVC